jgi:hypothetical protein
MKVKGVSKLASQVSLGRRTSNSEARHESSCLCDRDLLPDVLSSNNLYNVLRLSMPNVLVYTISGVQQ